MEETKTRELLKELIERNGVQHILIEPYQELKIFKNKEEQALIVDKGPVHILIIYD